MIAIVTDNCSKAEVAVPLRQEFIRTQIAYLAQLARKLRPFYAKQTQFAKSQNERKCLCTKGVYRNTPLPIPEKQTQFQTHRPRTAQPTINMQNKPNFPNARIHLTSYGHKEYEKMSVRELRKNKLNFKTAAPEPPSRL